MLPSAPGGPTPAPGRIVVAGPAALVGARLRVAQEGKVVVVVLVVVDVVVCNLGTGKMERNKL